MQTVPVRNFNADCEAYEEQQRRKHGTNNGHGGADGERGLGSTVDLFGLSEPQEWEIVTDVKTKTTYDVLLTKLNRHFVSLPLNQLSRCFDARLEAKRNTRTECIT